jgi:hypothetical protein
MKAKLLSVARFVLGLVYPVTKSKLHRLLHFAGLACTAAILVVVWLPSTGLHIGAQIEASFATIIVAATNIRAAIRKLDEKVDVLPIPDDSGKVLPLRPKDSGHGTPGVLLLLALAVGMSWAMASRAFCDETKPKVWDWGGAVAAAVGAFDLKTGEYLVGPNALPLGACLAVNYLPLRLGVDGCFNLQIGSAAPNRYFPSLMLHWRDYFNAGIGILGQQTADHTGLFWHFIGLLGGRFGFGGG